MICLIVPSCMVALQINLVGKHGQSVCGILPSFTWSRVMEWHACWNCIFSLAVKLQCDIYHVSLGWELKETKSTVKKISDQAFHLLSHHLSEDTIKWYIRNVATGKATGLRRQTTMNSGDKGLFSEVEQLGSTPQKTQEIRYCVWRQLKILAVLKLSCIVVFYGYMLDIELDGEIESAIHQHLLLLRSIQYIHHIKQQKTLGFW